jgi:hypothetical protein
MSIMLTMTAMTTPTLAEFLLARIEDDQRRAREVQGATPWNVTDSDPSHRQYWMLRVLADCEAKRRIVEAWQRVDADDRVLNEYAQNAREGRQTAFYSVLKLLALPFADHPDFLQEWRVTEWRVT